MSRLPGGRRGRLLSAAAVVVGLAAAYGVGTVGHAATVGASNQLGHLARLDVSAAVRACPGPGSAGATSGSVVTASAPGTSSGSSGPAGQITISRLTGTGSPAAAAALHTLTTAGVLNRTAVSTAPAPAAAKQPAKRSGKQSAPAKKKSGQDSASGGTQPGDASAGSDVATVPGRGGVVVSASGALAQGLAAEQTGPGGLVTAPCVAPGTDFWFVGPGVTTAPQVQLYLMNPTGQAADVEVDALTDSGPLVGSSDTGIVVPPHAQVTQSLSHLLRISRVIALHVSTSVGQVAAALRETKSSSDAGNWVPPAQAPGRKLVIPGVPGSAGTRDLFIVVPGTNSAQVKVTAITAKGSYQPTGGNGITMAGDSVAEVPLPSLSDVAAGLKITSTVPVTASVLVPGGAAGAAGAMSATTPAISQQGVAADNPAGSSGSASLVISAPGPAAASVQVVTATSKIGFSSQGATVVHVAAGHTVVTKIKPPRGGKSADFAVQVTPLPGSGPVYVGRVIQAGGVVRSILPIVSALSWVPLPPTEDSLSVGGTGR